MSCMAEKLVDGDSELLKNMTLAGCKAIGGRYVEDGGYCEGKDGDYRFDSIKDVSKPHPFVKGKALGGDDTAGMWLMLNLLNDGVPGRYVFFRDEERGCHGSRHMVSHNPDLFKGISKAVAFDRKGYTDVITTQSGRRTCSDKFASKLAGQLGDYKASDLGVYCDSASLTSLVPECTNLSIGYANAHHPEESLDLDFVEDLYHRLKKVDWASLPVAKERKIKKPLFKWWK